MTGEDRLAWAGRGMGRLVNHDEKSRAYGVRALSIPQAPQTRSWRRGAVYDQGASSHCVAYTGKGLLNSSPLSARVAYPVRSAYDVEAFYAGAQAHDDWPGTDYDGSSGLGLCRYLASIGLISEYRWAFGIAECLSSLSWIGPVGIGVDWLEGMLTADAYGYVHATGRTVAGHEVELCAIDAKRRTVLIANSWGRSWGANGYAWLSWADLELLLSRRGDAVVIVK